MKLIKKIIGALAVVIIVLLLFALFVNKNYAIKRKIEINIPQHKIFSYLKNLKNQDSFSKWGEMDPNMVKTYSGNDGNVGFIASWKSKIPEVGAGEQEIVKIKHNERIDFELRFKEPMESKSSAYFTIDQISEDKSIVTWGIEGKFEYPFNIMLPFMSLDEMIGNDLQIGLNNLKALLEENSERTNTQNP